MTQLPGTGGLVLAQEDRARVAHALEPRLGHREHADLVDRAKAVLDRPHQAETRMGVALEIQHRVDHVLEHARTGQRAFLGDMADQHDADAAGLGRARQVGRAFAHLRHRAGRRRELVGIHGLDRVDHRDRRAAPRPAWPGSCRARSRPAPTPGSGPAPGGARAAPPGRRFPRRSRTSVRWPAPCRLCMACSSSVDLPMPGSPPISTTPPSTMPPPSTRSSSSCPVGVRSVSTASMSPSVVTSAVWPATRSGCAPRRPGGPARPIRSGCSRRHRPGICPAIWGWCRHIRCRYKRFFPWPWGHVSARPVRRRHARVLHSAGKPGYI